MYIALIIWTPPPIITYPSEKKYRSHASPKKPLPLTPLADPGSVDLTIVVPAYNETERLPIMMASTIEHLASPAIRSKRTYEILIVDDGSTDDTSSTALQLAAKYPRSNIRVVTLEKNIGKGGAVRHGMLYGSGKRLLMADADGASRIEDLEALWEAMDELTLDNGPAVVVGSRAHLVKSEAVVKASGAPIIICFHLTFSPDSALFFAIFSCTACTPSSGSSVLDISGIHSAASSCSRVRLHNRYFQLSIFPPGYSTWNSCSWPNSCAFPSQRFQSSGMR